MAGTCIWAALRPDVSERVVLESPHLLGLVEEAKRRHPDLIERAETLSADKGYDDGEDKAELWDEHAIAPLIPARDCG